MLAFVVAAALLSSACSATSPPDGGSGASAKPKIEVRNAFARMQARLYEGCGQSKEYCASYLDSSVENLDFLLRAMNEDPKGADHFAAPVKWIKEMQEKVPDHSGGAIVKHEAEIVQTMKRVNEWMQGHPEDYR